MDFIRMDEKQFIPLRKQMYEIELEDVRKYKGITAEAYDSMHGFMEIWYPYKAKAAWWGQGLTAEQQLGFEPGSRKK